MTFHLFLKHRRLTQHIDYCFLSEGLKNFPFRTLLYTRKIFSIERNAKNPDRKLNAHNGGVEMCCMNKLKNNLWPGGGGEARNVRGSGD